MLAARAAFPAWAATPVAERVAAVLRIREGIKARHEELAQSITAEMGSPIAFSRSVQLGMPMATSKGVAGLAESFAWTEEIGNSLVVREPVGVVGAVTPWNYPLHQVVAKLAPALVAGCTVVLKPSEVAPLTAGALAAITAEAGLPAGVFNVVHGVGPEAGEALAAHPGVDMVSFTGSSRPAGGCRRSAGTVKRVALELGGKSANIVLDDADLAKAVKVGLGNCFINGGQTCTAWTRLLVPEVLHDEVVELAVAQTAKYTVGDPTDESHPHRADVLGDPARARRGYIERGIAEGAQLAVGGPGRPDGRPRGGRLRAADDLRRRPPRHDDRAGGDLRAGAVGDAVPDVDEAVEIANATIYGLAGAVFAGTQERGVEVARRMRTGQVDVNGGQFNPVAPFGGYKQSGTGRELGRYGLEEFLEIKSIQL